MNFAFTELKKGEAEAALSLYNQSTLRGEQYYRVMGLAEFEELFLTPAKPKDQVFAYYAPEHTGFIIGHFDGGLQRYFLTMIGVDPRFRRQKIASRLLEYLQQQIDQDAATKGLEAPSMEVSFYNPTQIRWVLPYTEGHTHMNAPGVLLGSGAHLFLKNQGFRDFSYQNSYHLDLQKYVYPQKEMERYEAKMQQRGYSVEFYNPSKHTDMQGLVDDLNNDLWNRQIPEEMNRKGGPRPLLIVNDHGTVGGFAGPIVLEEDGRGWLLGLAVHSKCRGAGAATILFNRMCEAFRDAGGSYMTIFTSEDNFARDIYETAGFRIHASWADMRRKVTKH